MSIETIVDSKLMIGENLPVCQVEISGGGLGEPTDLVRQGTAAFQPVAMSRWIPKTAGGYLCCYLNASKQLVTGTCSDLAFVDTDDAVESEATQAGITTNTAYANGMDVVTLADGSALLAILDRDTPDSTRVYVYKSASGNGGDWVLLASFSYGTYTSTKIWDCSECHIVANNNGDLFISANQLKHYITGSNGRSGGMIYKSEDAGATWSKKLDVGGSVTAVRGISQIGFLPDRFWCHITRTNYTTLYESTDGGDTWSNVGNIGGTAFDSLQDPSLQGASSFYESSANVVLVHLTYPFGSPNVDDGGLFQLTDPTTARIDEPSNFERLSSFGDLTTALSARMYSLAGNVVIHLQQADKQRIYTVRPESLALQGVTAAAANHKQGAAASAAVVLDNPGGIYSYDGAANTHMVGPNKEVTIYMGYGAEREKVFYGLIDKINARSFPQKLAFNCRDMGKKALDGSITNDTDPDKHTVTFANMQAEAIFTTLGTWAGFTDIRVEVSGVTIDLKTWNWAKYVDAFNWLCDMTGFDWHVDNDGVLWFKKRATNVPRSEDEEHALVLDESEYKCTLGHHPILEGSYVIKNVAEDVTYTKDTDYTLDLATGELVAREGGALASGGTIHPKYTYPRHVFQEGVNLTVLEGYTIDDKPLFYKIFAYGKDSTGEPISATWTMTTNTYNVLESKHRRIKIDCAVTQAQLQAIVDRAGDDMLRTARVCKCKVVGLPTLKNGDCVQIIESSTTVSEIYRVTELSHNFSSSGEPLSTTFTTYHYGYAPIVEGGS